MQQRRFRPGDVLDDYCPRERRITDHAIVAMIDDNIKQTRCCVCDAEHEFKDGKVPPQRRKKAQAALFSQVLEGLQGPHVVTNAADVAELSPTLVETNPAEIAQSVNGNGSDSSDSTVSDGHDLIAAAHVEIEPIIEPIVEANGDLDGPLLQDEGRVRRSLIRATLPRPEGQAPPTRVMPEFTIRQPGNGRGSRHGRRRGGHHQGQGGQGPMRFGRGSGGHGPGHGQPHHGGRNHNSNGGRPRRGGKKR